MKIKKIITIGSFLVLTTSLSSGCSRTKTLLESMSIDGYELKQSVVLSRHNIRSPLSGNGSLLESITPYKWYEWTSKPSELSKKGEALETKMGAYFRDWIDQEKLRINFRNQKDNELRVYANAKQRTIRTSECFVSGFYPNKEIEVETQAEYDTMDPVFNPQLTFSSQPYDIDAYKQMIDIYNDFKESLRYDCYSLSNIIDFKESKAFKSGEVSNFDVDEIDIQLLWDQEPAVSGSLKLACSISDALVLQYYEEMNELVAGFGHDLSINDWHNIAEIKDIYGDVLFSAPLISYNVAHPLLKLIKDEITNENRRFSYLCGHDSNITSVLSALEVEKYNLIDSIEGKTPIGGKIVFNTYLDKSGREYFGVNYVYQSYKQLREISDLTLERPPMIVPLYFKDLVSNEHGLYKKDAFLSKLDNSINQYDVLFEKYMN